MLKGKTGEIYGGAGDYVILRLEGVGDRAFFCKESPLYFGFSNGVQVKVTAGAYWRIEVLHKGNVTIHETDKPVEHEGVMTEMLKFENADLFWIMVGYDSVREENEAEFFQI
jgi:hypothetical protein